MKLTKEQLDSWAEAVEERSDDLTGDLIKVARQRAEAGAELAGAKIMLVLADGSTHMVATLDPTDEQLEDDEDEDDDEDDD